jgi:hypothetical protein
MESRPPRQWREIKSALLNDSFHNSRSKQKTSSSVKYKDNSTAFQCEKDMRSAKFRHCVNYITYVADLYADTCPTKEGICCVPYEKTEQFYHEYVQFCRSGTINKTSQGSKETFRRALKSLKDKVRLVGCKGKNVFVDIISLIQLITRALIIILKSIYFITRCLNRKFSNMRYL